MTKDEEVDNSAGPPLAAHLAPLALCLAAGLILALAPFVVWQAVTGRFVCIDTPDVRYGLQIAAQPYYGHSWYLTDPAVAGGVTYYSWLQYGLAAFAARAFGLSIFSISVMWKVWAGLGLAASLYLVFWLLLGARWIAAGCAIYLLSDSGTCCYFSHPVIDHLRRVASALIKHRHSVLNLAPEPLWQLGVPHPGVVLPFAFFQIAAIVRARGSGGRWSCLLPGLIFALTFYLYFYLWTTIAIGLAIAAVFDREGCRLYLRTLGLGALLGSPQVVRDLSMSARVSAEALHRFGLMVRATSMDALGVPYAGIAILAICALLIWHRKHRHLKYPWSLAAGGMLLSRGSAFSGIALHQYHWDWFWQPILALVLTVVVVSEFRGYFERRPLMICVSCGFVALYFLGGLYLTMEASTRTPVSSRMVATFANYRAQRMKPSALRLRPGAIIGGDEDFCDLSVIGEDQRALSGFALSRSLGLDDVDWRERLALNAYLLEMSPVQLRQRVLDEEYWGPLPDITSATMTAFLREYAEIARDPSGVLDKYGVRYMVLDVGKLPPPAVRDRWELIQSGPHWDLWERK